MIRLCLVVVGALLGEVLARPRLQLDHEDDPSRQPKPRRQPAGAVATRDQDWQRTDEAEEDPPLELERGASGWQSQQRSSRDPRLMR